MSRKLGGRPFAAPVFLAAFSRNMGSLNLWLYAAVRPKALIKEFDILCSQKTKNPKFVRIWGFWFFAKAIYLFFEYFFTGH